MKFKLFGFFIFLNVFLGCKKDIPDPPTKATYNTNTGSYNQYDVTFYTNSKVVYSPFTVILNSESRDITYWMNYAPPCNEAGCANFTIPPGTYSYTASEGGGKKWTGSITTGASQCITIGLN